MCSLLSILFAQDANELMTDDQLLDQSSGVTNTGQHNETRTVSHCHALLPWTVCLYFSFYSYLLASYFDLWTAWPLWPADVHVQTHIPHVFVLTTLLTI